MTPATILPYYLQVCALGTGVIAVGNRFSNPSSNPVWGWAPLAGAVEYTDWKSAEE